jgi:hypothetical protein
MSRMKDPQTPLTVDVIHMHAPVHPADHKSHRSQAGHRALLRALAVVLFVIVLAGLVAAIVGLIRPRLASAPTELTSYAADIAAARLA